MQSTIYLCQAAVALTLLSSGSLWAQGVSPAHALSVPVAVSGLGVPVAAGLLEGYRGGFDTVNNDMQLSGSVAGNTTSNVVAGNNFIGEGSFSHANGFPMVIQNSGSNVLIQNATIINLQYQ